MANGQQLAKQNYQTTMYRVTEINLFLMLALILIWG